MFGNTGIVSGPFSDTLNVEVPELGSVSSSITSVAISLLTDVSFSSVTLNGHEFNIDEIGATENRSFLNLPVTSGMQTLVINGTSGGSGSYSGTLAFAVPEPASWAMMIAGFGLLGGAIRVRKRQVKVSFALCTLPFWGLHPTTSKDVLPLAVNSGIRVQVSFNRKGGPRSEE